MKKTLGFLVAFVVLCGIAGAQETKPMHVLMAPADLKWGDPPPVFEKGMSFAVVSGDPSKPGVFVVMAKVPAGYKINPHWHPTDENVTVLSGTFAFGMGEKLDAASMKELPRRWLCDAARKDAALCHGEDRGNDPDQCPGPVRADLRQPGGRPEQASAGEVEPRPASGATQAWKCVIDIWNDAPPAAR